MRLRCFLQPLKVMSRSLLSFWLDIPPLGFDGQNPLFCAANEGHQEVVDLLPLTTDQVLSPCQLLFFSSVLSLHSLSLSLSLCSLISFDIDLSILLFFEIFC